MHKRLRVSEPDNDDECQTGIPNPHRRLLLNWSTKSMGLAVRSSIRLSNGSFGDVRQDQAERCAVSLTIGDKFRSN